MSKYCIKCNRKIDRIYDNYTFEKRGIKISGVKILLRKYNYLHHKCNDAISGGQE